MSLLEIIQNHSQLLKTHEERISKLETNNAQLIRNNNDLCREIEQLKAGYRTPSDTISRSLSDNITISGVPFTIRDSPQIITERVFGALGVAELAGDVLEIRSVNKKVASNANVLLPLWVLEFLPVNPLLFNSNLIGLKNIY